MAAAGRERRAERLNERLRGAQRTNVGDDSFNLNIDGLDQPPAKPSSSPSRTPNVSARKRKRNDEQKHEASQDRRATRSATKAPPDSAGASKESSGPPTARSRQSDRTNGSSSRATRSSSRPGLVPATQTDLGADELEAVAPLPASMQSPERSRLSGAMIEEVEESPAHAPGSGRRRNLQLSASASSTARRLQYAVSTDDAAPPSSSPLVRKARMSDAAASMRSRGSAGAVSRRPMSGEEDELLSDDRPRDATVEEELPDPLPIDEDEPETQGQPEEAEASAEEAEEIDATEAAKALGRKRPRRSIRTSSPELGSGAVGAEQGEPEPEPESEPKTRQKHSKSRSKQKLKPRPKPKPHKDPSPEKKQRKRNPAPSKTVATKRRESGGNDDDDDDAIEITVQRFVNNKKQAGGDGDDDGLDPLQSEIPFANRIGESVVDVLAQVCDEVMAATLAQFRQLADEADSAAKKKECRVKMRAIEAYREELGSRLLQHAIHLNHWHSLRKQVQHAQKEKLALRGEILRLKGEREQVALRMDAVRTKHEADSKESTRRINTSTLMHDIDVAVEQGREAPELSRDAQKQVDLGNLELMLARVADEASSGSSTGGMLRQVTEFNAFLERAALALESR
ncbi:triadin [Hirsutella rhossiliensis]|uniref:Triadin n=1 Tax=Hirsutella rhossiliensis TaxID=111463 RepID=A0A9P8SDW8_9HYPO|nr:triadin [Hirsutella rhossiliensis]KAH0959193.1 triadin [Hirsutella rhossiliensis]